jgi:hypothetical protein
MRRSPVQRKRRDGRVGPSAAWRAGVGSGAARRAAWARGVRPPVRCTDRSLAAPRRARGATVPHCPRAPHESRHARHLPHTPRSDPTHARSHRHPPRRSRPRHRRPARRRRPRRPPRARPRYYTDPRTAPVHLLLFVAVLVVSLGLPGLVAAQPGASVRGPPRARCSSSSASGCSTAPMASSTARCSPALVQHGAGPHAVATAGGAGAPRRGARPRRGEPRDARAGARRRPARHARRRRACR